MVESRRRLAQCGRISLPGAARSDDEGSVKAHRHLYRRIGSTLVQVCPRLDARERCHRRNLLPRCYLGIEGTDPAFRRQTCSCRGIENLCRGSEQLAGNHDRDRNRQVVPDSEADRISIADDDSRPRKGRCRQSGSGISAEAPEGDRPAVRHGRNPRSCPQFDIDYRGVSSSRSQQKGHSRQNDTQSLWRSKSHRHLLIFTCPPWGHTYRTRQDCQEHSAIPLARGPPRPWSENRRGKYCYWSVPARNDCATCKNSR